MTTPDVFALAALTFFAGLAIGAGAKEPPAPRDPVDDFLREQKLLRRKP